MSKETNENRRRINQLLGVIVGGGIVSAFADGYIWQESQKQTVSQRETTRGSLNREEVEEIRSCLDEGSRS